VNLPAERSRVGTVDEGAVLDDRHVGSEEATRLALEFLEASAGKQLFLWVHYFDAHTPVRVPDDLASSARTASERYDAALTGIDRSVATLLRRLDGPDLNDRVLVALFSDHGEEQGEHGGSFHNTSVYEELTRVPLAFRGTGVRRGVSREDASLVDLWQTLARVVGAGDPGSPSHDLWPVLGGGPDRPRVVATELDSTAGQRHTAVIVGRWKAIVNVRSGTRELYDLDLDPLERTPLPLDDPDRELPHPIRRFLGRD
jgi:arylsulfatase A-like enzyme